MTFSGYLTSKSFRPALCCRIDASLESSAQIRMKIDPYYPRQKCRPMTLVSGNIRFMQIFAGVRLRRGVKRHWGLSATAIFGDLGGYTSSKNFRDTASNIIWRYATPCRPVTLTECRMNKNTFCGTRYLSHCCSFHGTVVVVT